MTAHVHLLRRPQLGPLVELCDSGYQLHCASAVCRGSERNSAAEHLTVGTLNLLHIYFSHPFETQVVRNNSVLSEAMHEKHSNEDNVQSSAFCLCQSSSPSPLFMSYFLFISILHFLHFLFLPPVLSSFISVYHIFVCILTVSPSFFSFSFSILSLVYVFSFFPYPPPIPPFFYL